MNKKEAYAAMLEGKFVRHKYMDKHNYIFMSSEMNVEDNDGYLFNLNGYYHEDWSLFLKEPEKRKFYRRKWIISMSGTYLWMNGAGYPSIAEFDAAHEGCELSPEIEEMEV